MPAKLPTNSAVRGLGRRLAAPYRRQLFTGSIAAQQTSPDHPHCRPGNRTVCRPLRPHGGVDLSLSIGDALHQLTDEQRAVIIAIDVEGLPAEVARRLDLPVGTIKSRSSRARARLARLSAISWTPTWT